MVSVGIRELRQQASELLRRVQLGETIEITDRGRPVAILGPVPAGSPLMRLRESGEIIPAAGDIDDLPARLLPMELRCLDAIHLATAQQLGVSLAGVVTYDARMLAAAGDLGLSVAAPT